MRNAASLLALVGLMCTPPAAIAVAAAPAVATQHTIPFTMPDGHIHVPVVINGHTYDFLFDTGGAGTLMPQVAQQLHLPVIGQARLGGAGGASISADIVRASVDLGGASIADTNFIVLSGPLAAMGGAFDGIIGREFFTDYAVTIDYPHHVLTLTPLSQFVPPAGVKPVALSLRRGAIPNIVASVNGSQGRFDLDSGSSFGLTLTQSFVSAHALTPGLGNVRPLYLGTGVGGDVTGTVGRAQTLTIGDTTIPRPIAAIAQSVGVFAQPDLSGNIGPDVLKRFALTLDVKSGAAYFIPDASASAPMPFNRSGLFVKRVSADRFQAALVWPNSPAAQAGIAAGDEIVSVAGLRPDVARNRNMWTQAAGTRVQVVFKHDGTTETRTLVLQDLL